MWKFETKGGLYFETVDFGDLKWQVLDESSDGSMKLLIAESIVEERPYHSDDEVGPNLTWETSEIRFYLNNDFIENHFSIDEQNRICLTELENKDNDEFGSAGGNDTQDKVFLLSIEEAEEYYYTGDLGALQDWWWLRSPGESGDWPAFFSAEPTEDEDGEETYLCKGYGDGTAAEYGIRPALWLKN